MRFLGVLQESGLSLISTLWELVGMTPILHNNYKLMCLLQNNTYIICLISIICVIVINNIMNI